MQAASMCCIATCREKMIRMAAAWMLLHVTSLYSLCELERLQAVKDQQTSRHATANVWWHRGHSSSSGWPIRRTRELDSGQTAYTVPRSSGVPRTGLGSPSDRTTTLKYSGRCRRMHKRWRGTATHRFRMSRITSDEAVSTITGYHAPRRRQYAPGGSIRAQPIASVIFELLRIKTAELPRFTHC